MPASRTPPTAKGSSSKANAGLTASTGQGLVYFPPYQILRDAIKAVPAVKYALGVVGVVAAVAVVGSFRIGYGVAVFGAVVVFVLMVLLLVFAKLTQTDSRYFTTPAVVLMWTFLLLTIATAALLFTSVFFNKPLDLTWLKFESTPKPVPEEEVLQLANGSDPAAFDGWFHARFVPVSWNNLGQVLTLNRLLTIRGRPLWNKTYDATTRNVDPEKLSADEKKSYDYVNGALLEICSQIAAVLRTSRPTGASLNLSRTEFIACDLGDVDLSGANIESIALDTVNLEGANLSNISQFDGAYFYHAAWWKAKNVSPKLRKYLEDNTDSRYEESARYGPSGEAVTPEQYAIALKELKHRSR